MVWGVRRFVAQSLASTGRVVVTALNADAVAAHVEPTIQRYLTGGPRRSGEEDRDRPRRSPRLGPDSAPIGFAAAAEIKCGDRDRKVDAHNGGHGQRRVALQRQVAD